MKQVVDAQGERGLRRSRIERRRALHAVETGDELAQIVHDLKNPLSSIALEIDLLQERRRCEHELELAVGRIRRNVWFLDRLIYNLVDLCALAHGPLALHRTRTELDRLLTDAVDRVVPTRERERVALQVASPTPVSIDALRIERVIANLLDNALKYTPRHAAISVRLSRGVRCAEISVSDTGPGLTRDEVASIFEPYRRASTSHAHPGSGLGLYVSKQIVEAHGGYIGVESVRGFGTQFYFTLPIAAEP